MAKRDVKTTVGYKVDTQSERQAKQSVERVKGAQVKASQDTVKSVRDVVKQYQTLARIEGDVEQQSKNLASALKRIGASDNEIKRATNEFDDLTSSIRRSEQATEQLSNRFDRVSRGVGAAGDVQSNLGAIQGLTGVAGAGGAQVSGGIGVAGEVVVLVEELPRLKESLAGMPQTISNAVRSLGVGGVVGGLGLIGAIGAVAVVASLATSASKKQAQQERIRLEAQREAFEFSADATAEQVRLEQQSIEDQLFLQRSMIDELESERRELYNQYQESTELEQLVQPNDPLQDIFEREAFYEANLGETEDEIRRVNDEIARLTQLHAEYSDQLTSAIVVQNEIAHRQQQRHDDAVRRIGEEVDIRLQHNQLVRQGADAVRDQLEVVRQEIELRQEQISQLQGIGEDTTALNQQLENLQRQELLLSTRTLGLAEARERELDAIEQTTSAILDSAQSQGDAIREINRLQNMSGQSLQQRIADLEAENQAIIAERQALIDSGDTSEEVTQRIEELTQSLLENGNAIARTRDEILPLVQAEEERIATEQRLVEAEEERIAAEQRLIQSTEQYNADIERINEQRAKLEQQHADKLVSIAEKALEDSEQALAKLQEAYASASTDLGRANLEAQIEAQRLERDSLKNHLRQIRDINKRNEDAEFEAILNRDFRQLFQLRRQKTRDINNANQQFNDSRADQIQALDDQRQDRLRAYNQQLVDAQAQYQKESALINQRKQQAIASENDRLRAEQQAIKQQISLRRQGWLQEIQLAQQGAQALVQIEAQKNQALVTQAQQALALIMTGGKRGMNFAGGDKYNTSNKTMNNTFTINGNNTKRMEQTVYKVLNKVMT